MKLKFKSRKELKHYLDAKVKEVNQADFIKDDPILIPKQYARLQDVEITAFWTAMMAWGQRVTIINKATELFSLMGDSPYDFIVNHKEKDRERFQDFKHRTFQYTDTLYFLEFLQQYYKEAKSMETLFVRGDDMKETLTLFHNTFFALPVAPHRTRKHVATPARNSACKRLNMFLRWMVRKDEADVDFGLWTEVPTRKLMMPLDVHVERVGRRFNLLKRKQRDWKAVEELTQNLRKFDPEDPVKYDFALFGIGVLGEM